MPDKANSHLAAAGFAIRGLRLPDLLIGLTLIRIWSALSQPVNQLVWINDSTLA